MSTFYLLEELVVNILSHLLPKTLIRFRCVSKTWLALIGTLDFISESILNLSILATKCQNPNPQLLLVKSRIQPCCDKQTYSFLSYDTLLNCGFRIPLNLPLRPVLRHHWNHPYPTSYLDLNIVASYDGLLCLYDYTGHSNIYLWNHFNAATLTELEVLPPMTRGHYMLNDKFVGFGFDSRSNDFKIVWIYSDCVAECMARLTRKLYPGEVGIGGEGVGVYSLSIGSWRQVKHDPKMISGILPYQHMTAYINGLFF